MLWEGMRENTWQALEMANVKKKTKAMPRSFDDREISLLIAEWIY